MTGRQMPIVEYLVLNPRPHLVVLECETCAAQFFGRRNACASCFGSTFSPHQVANVGVVQTFTVVCTAEPGIEVPFIAAVVDCAGVSVAGNIIGCAPDPESLSTGMEVQLALTSLGVDDGGVEAIGFGFKPVGTQD